MSIKYSGRCLCGNVRYVAEGKPKIVAQCHCEECRRLSGTGHTIGAMFSSSDVTVTGKVSCFKYRSGLESEVTRVACANCASPIYGTNTRTLDYLTLALGSMDDANGLDVEVVVFAREKQHWDQLGQDVTSFATQPDWRPND